MEIEVMIPSPPIDFNFDSACTSPYVSAPSSPHQFGNFFHSAPTSPTRAANLFRQLNTSSSADASPPSKIPFNWEEKPGTPKTKHKTDENKNRNENDFEFDFSGQLQRTSLFRRRALRRRKNQTSQAAAWDAIRRTRTYRFSEITKIAEIFNKHKDFQRICVSENIRRSISIRSKPRSKKLAERIKVQRIEEERERTIHPTDLDLYLLSKFPTFSPKMKTTDLVQILQYRHKPSTITPLLLRSSSSASSWPWSWSSSISASAWRGYKNWKLRDLLLFRSASEGRASTEEVKHVSFRSTESAGSASKRRGPVSAHEMHYTANRALSEEMRRKTVLPYKHGLLGCLGFKPVGFKGSIRGSRHLHL
ncbi:calmodulin-binding protein [Actinidia rufa]|uniref:Calmodulin-binding protein n=1 Tax=Actinidia rufa TaxID=165716 RepID=A0A7J0F9Z5_9ERIC|nr:calmodulin-binding protein [Actinidia rufa]